MPDISNSVPSELPSTRTLLRSTLMALVIASVLLAVVVLPAEYGVDPTGIGSVLGLTEMGRIKTSLAAEVTAAEVEVSAATAPSAPSGAPPAIEATELTTAPADDPLREPGSHTASVTLQPNQGREIKLLMREGAKATYAWSTDRGVVNYDLHADSQEPPRDYHGYRKGMNVGSDEGDLVAAFDGWHGWFWRNRSAEPLTVTLRVEGEFLETREVK